MSSTCMHVCSHAGGWQSCTPQRILLPSVCLIQLMPGIPAKYWGTAPSSRARTQLVVNLLLSHIPTRTPTAEVPAVREAADDVGQRTAEPARNRGVKCACHSSGGVCCRSTGWLQRRQQTWPTCCSACRRYKFENSLDTPTFAAGVSAGREGAHDAGQRAAEPAGNLHLGAQRLSAAAAQPHRRARANAQHAHDVPVPG